MNLLTLLWVLLNLSKMIFHLLLLLLLYSLDWQSSQMIRWMSLHA